MHLAGRCKLDVKGQDEDREASPTALMIYPVYSTVSEYSRYSQNLQRAVPVHDHVLIGSTTADGRHVGSLL